MQARIIERCLCAEQDHVPLDEAITVRHISSAEEALRRLREGAECSLLLIDWMLPGMSGLELVEAVRASNSFGDLPIIMQTAHNRREHVEAAIEAGVTDYIAKPLDCATVRQSVYAVQTGSSARFAKRPRGQEPPSRGPGH